MKRMLVFLFAFFVSLCCFSSVVSQHEINKSIRRHKQTTKSHINTKLPKYNCVMIGSFRSSVKKHKMHTHYVCKNGRRIRYNK